MNRPTSRARGAFLFTLLAAGLVVAGALALHTRRRPPQTRALGVSVHRAILAHRALAAAPTELERLERTRAFEQASARLPKPLTDAIASMDMAALARALPAPLLLVDATVLRPVARLGDATFALVLDEPMPNDHADDWLLAHGMVSLRALERELVTLWLARMRANERCPVAIRVRDYVALGALFDETYAASAEGAPVLEPLCRRERLRLLLEEAMRAPFPFAPGIFIGALERAWLEAVRAPGPRAGKVRSLRDAFEDADTALRSEDLMPSAQTLLQLLAEDAAMRTHGLACAYARSRDKRRFIASLADRFTREQWPDANERDAIIAFLYALAGETIPAEGAVSAPHLLALWTRAATLPAGPPCIQPPLENEHIGAILARAALDGDEDMQ